MFASRRCGRAPAGWAGGALASILAVLACSSGAYAFLRPLEPPDVAVLRNGVVWADRTRVLFQGFLSGTVSLGGIGTVEPLLASSGDAVALLGRGSSEEFAGAIPPARLAPIGQVFAEVHGGGCPGWAPLTHSAIELGDFVVAGHELIDAGRCQGEGGGEQEASSQPLFIRNVRGGEWRVLRWLRGDRRPILAAEGNLLAIGAQTSLRLMRVTVIDLTTRHLVARFDTSNGHLSFASPRRLVLSVPLPLKAAEADLAPVTGPARTTIRRQLPPYRLELYSVTGRRLAELGTAAEPPLSSHMHLVEVQSGEGGSVLVVRGIGGGPVRRLIAFKEPARSLEGVAFRWPAVAVVESTSMPLAQSEVTCRSGEYHPPGAPFLAIFDLARSEPFVSPPPSAHLSPAPGPCPVFPRD